MELKRLEYDQKLNAASLLRGKAMALNIAKVQRGKLRTWMPSSRIGTEIDIEKQAMLGRTVAETVDYFDNKCSNALEVLAEDKMCIGYQMYYDIDRPAVLGLNTMTTNIPVTWSKLDVEIRHYTSDLKRVAASEKITSAARDGIPNRDDISKATGWSRDAMRQLGDDRMQTLRVLLESSVVGQEKLSRLVKGYLWLLECMERQTVNVTVDTQNYVLYNPDRILDSYRHQDRAYVFNSKTESVGHTAVLFKMCQEYPPKEFNSHVHIPADGENIFMVAQGQLPPNNVTVTLNPGIIHASILTYAMDTSITDQLQSALLIACSLHQNRYFSKMRLPRVVSTYDLMVPAYIAQSSQLNEPIISINLAKSLGRLHQMLAFVTARDIMSAGEMTTKQGYDPSVSIINCFKSSNQLIARMAENIGPLALLETTKQLQIYQWITKDDIEDLATISIMEGLWLATTASKVVHNGVIAAIMDGSKDMTGDTSTYDLLKQEVAMSGVNLENEKLPPPTGAFTVGWFGMTKSNNIRPPRSFKVKTVSLKLVQECDFKPNTKVQRRQKKRISPSGEVIKANTVTSIKLPSPPKYRDVVSEESISSTKTEDQPIIDTISEESSDAETSERDISEPSSQDGKEEINMPEEKEKERDTIYRATTLAHEAKAKKNRVSFKSLENVLETNKKEVIDSAAKLRNQQLSEEENVATILKKDGLSQKERGEWLALISMKSNMLQAVTLGNIEKITTMLEEKKLDGVQLLNGNNKYTKRVNINIERWNSDKIVSEFGRARELKSAWYGDPNTLPRSAMPFIVNSTSWLRELEDRDVVLSEQLPMRKDGNFKEAAKVIAEVIRYSETLTVKDVGSMYHWLSDVKQNLLPVDIPADSISGNADMLTWRREPSSISERPVNQEDSRWLVLAATSRICKFDVDALKVLCSHFTVPVSLRKELKDKYELFQQRK
ncbi:capsid protein [Chrysothrix chrysovirus 1]|uniref:Capsid protein n=1 Tax=Chrysothrix chrysovirus 1 TaxID=2682569 RepID=A0A650D803_9VIRU|nr:capsid protein [Chrysothrix chrysovirus 1]QGR26539.1 capsid protein [Chrysothrix chrysovirus 1]